ncbi:hypothetical protein NDU88_003823 [Pleurodeles waltl]|uniref:Uncharacterized protein n=1 Tax=Pleurodeles waltl TaxID=8319 RepID=A0AAV7T6N9_PLEWA|nr:hypothetical protein NDU88_003823 [Pleurodeles waltl]
MRGENRSPSLGSHSRRSGEDDTRLEKVGAAGRAARKMDRDPCCDPTRWRRSSQCLDQSLKGVPVCDQCGEVVRLTRQLSLLDTMSECSLREQQLSRGDGPCAT